MPSWTSAALRRIRQLARARRVRFTHKAVRELGALDLDADDAVSVLVALDVGDAHDRIRSLPTAEWLYIFKPLVGGGRIYLKVAIREDCIVVSFHEDEDEDEGPP